MTDRQLGEIIQWFLQYPERFRDPEGRLHSMMELKRDHSRRVAEYCRYIAREMDWSPEEVNTAEAAGWLHDLGRFPQWAEFETFYDPVSLNHAEKGRDILEQENILAVLPRPEEKAILDAVSMHNKRDLPEDIAPASLPLVKLVRDGDKLDIYDVVWGHLTAGSIKQLLPGISTDRKASPALLEELARDGRASYHNVKTVPDFLLTQISWVNNVNYAPSFRHIAEKGLVDRLRDYLPCEEPGVESLIETAGERIREGSG